MKYQHGVSFIELLVSLSLLSFMLLGLDAMEMVSLQETKSNYYFSQAKQQIQILLERLQTADSQTSLDEITELWNIQNQSVLPQGRGLLSGHYPHYTVTLFWGNKKTSSCTENHIGQSGCLTLHEA